MGVGVGEGGREGGRERRSKLRRKEREMGWSGLPELFTENLSLWLAQTASNR